MGAAASLMGESAQEFENFKKIRDAYEAKVAAGASDTELYDHIHALMSTLGGRVDKLSLDLLTTKNDHNNCSEDIIARANLHLLATEASKVGQMRMKVEAALQATAESNGWNTDLKVDAPCPVVSTRDNFDVLKVPAGHYTRLPSDTYHCDNFFVLRTQLTAHMPSIVKGGKLAYYMSGEIFRIIEEDDMQAEMQHKLEFVRIFDSPATPTDEEQEHEYMRIAEGVVKGLVGEQTKTRWEESDEAFHLVGEAFTDLQALLGGHVAELARGGQLTDEVLADLGFESGKSGYIITFDLDHLAMFVNVVSDIRYVDNCTREEWSNISPD